MGKASAPNVRHKTLSRLMVCHTQVVASSAERARSPAGASSASPGPVEREVRRLMISAIASVMAYCMSSSACRSIDGGIVSPRAFAVLRLITSSNLVGCSTGSSAGLAPLRILST